MKWVLAAGADPTKLIEDLAKRKKIKTLGVSMGQGQEIIARIERLAALGDVVKASDEDLEALWPDRSLEESARHLLAFGPCVVVVTRGGDGAMWVSASAHGEIEAVPVVVVADTIGAGDTFGAGLVDALWELGRLGGEHREALRSLDRAEVVEVLEHAARAAAVTVSRPGADPPWKHELS